MITRSTFLSFGAKADLDEVSGYVEGRHSVTFGQSHWTPPSQETIDIPVYDNEGNVIETQSEIYNYDGYHSFEGPLTTLSIAGFADTNSNYHLSATGEHTREVDILGENLDFRGYGSLGVDSDYGSFAEAGAEIRKILHGDSGTYGYARSEIRIAENNNYSDHFVESGIGTSVLNNMTGINFIPTIETGLRYNGEDVTPRIGIGINF